MADPTASVTLDYSRLGILGGELSGLEDFAGRVLLAEFHRHAPDAEDEGPEADAADREELEGLDHLARVPGFTFREVEVKLAYAYRLAQWDGVSGNGPYGAACAALLASSLADVVLLRTAELARLDREERQGETTLASEVKAEMVELRREMAELRAGSAVDA